MTFSELASIIRRYWIVLFVVTVSGVLVAGAFNLYAKPTYNAVATISVQVENSDKNFDGLIQSENKETVITDFLVRNFVLPEGIPGNVNVSQSNKKSILVTSSDANKKNAVDAVSIASQSLIESAQQYSLSDDSVMLSIEEPPIVTIVPEILNSTQSLILGGLIGLFLTFITILSVDTVFRKIQSKRDIEAITRFPVIAQITKLSSDEDAYRKLRALTFNEEPDGRLQTLVFATPGGESNIFQVVQNLAQTYVEAGYISVVIDARALPDSLVSVAEPGLGELFQGTITVDELFRKHSQEEVLIITRGSAIRTISDFLTSQQFDQLIGKLYEYAQVILIITSPVLDDSDSIILGKKLGKIHLVLETGLSVQRNLVKALNTLSLSPSIDISLVLLQKN